MPIPNIIRRVIKHADVAIAFGIIAIVLLMIIPLHPSLLDLLLVFNITCSLLILLVSMYNKEALDFSIFPSLLLVMTLYRLSLNISSTRLILLRGYAGSIIQQFGQFVVGGNPLVGLIIFLILVVIQFIVITKGAERVAEVAARFTLDAMPGKQMSIDADLNAGLITEDDARKRRNKIQREADFYGAMDGASKFVKGDAIASIVITLINILGGMAVGLLQRDMGGVGEVANTYTLLTVGDGLVSQIPALLLSTATGIIVTRAASDNSLGEDLIKQVFSQVKLLLIAATVLLILGFVPGLPRMPFFVIGIALAVLAVLLTRSRRVIIKEEQIDAQKTEEDDMKKTDSVYSLLHVDPIELELGYGLIPLVDSKQGGDLLERVVMIRRQCALELGIVIPPIRIRDNMQLQPNNYVFKLKGIPMAKGELMLSHYLAMGGDMDLEGIETKEPAFGLPAVWITEAMREKAEMNGNTVVDPPSVLATHITEFLKSHAAEILSRQDVKGLLDNLKREYPAVVDDVYPNVLSLAEIQKVLSNLLNEQIPVRDLVSIIEALGDWAHVTKDPDLLTEYVRQKLARQIGRLFADESEKMYCITLEPQVEEVVKKSIQRSEHGSYLAIDPTVAQKIITNINDILHKEGPAGKQIVALVSPSVRLALRRLVERAVPRLPVISYNEIPQNLDIESVGMVKI